MYHFFLVVFLIIAISLIILVMLQQNNDVGGIFDNRSLGSILNTGTFNNGINRVIMILAMLFFLLSLLLGNMNSKQNQHYSVDSNQKIKS